MFVWVGDDSRKMPNLCASSANKYVRPTRRPWRRSVPPSRAQARCGAVPDACGQHPDGRSLGPVLGAQRARRGLLPALRCRLNPPLTSGPQPTQRDERGFCVLCTAKRLPETMVLASYLLPAEPAILHDVAAKKVLQLLEPLIAAQKGAS